MKKRRHYRGPRDPYMESDRDFVDNNMRACVWFLENRDKINELLKTTVTDTEMARLLYGDS